MNERNLLHIVKWILGRLRSWFRHRNELALETIVLRQPLSAFKLKNPRPSLSDTDRTFWVLLRRLWSNGSNALIVVTPDAVVRWHRNGFRHYWNGLSRKAAPEHRAAQTRPLKYARVVALPRVGGLHHRCAWREARKIQTWTQAL